MLSEHSDDLANLFKEGKEADFFRSKEELIEKLTLYLGDEQLRHAVAVNGYRRVMEGGHDVVSRMKQVLEHVEKIRLSERKLRA